MPYIPKSDRNYLKFEIQELCRILDKYEDEKIEGILNYTISTIVSKSLSNRNENNKVWRYKWINRAIGVFECAKLEFYRRLASKQEDNAILKNGDLDEYL